MSENLVKLTIELSIIMCFNKQKKKLKNSRHKIKRYAEKQRVETLNSIPSYHGFVFVL